MKKAKTMDLFDLYNSCTLCPRSCGADRTHGKTGVCGESAALFAARATLHMWEEPIISGTRGSGAVFFSGCPLRCVFCQNGEISHRRAGYPVTCEHLSDIFLSLQRSGAHNINLVTGSHFIPHIVKAVKAARENGLSIPIVYNSSGYESVASLRLLDGIVDVYLPDFKYISGALSAKLSLAPDYPEAAKAALEEMVRQTGPLTLGGDGTASRGVVVRHLVLPKHTHEAIHIIEYLYNKYGNDIFISIMGQYTPPPGMENELARRITKGEYSRVIDFAVSLGVTNGFFQSLSCATSEYVPVFDGTGIIF